MTKRIVLVILGFYISSSNGQNNDSQAAVYNVIVGSVFGGIGSLINKKKNEPWLKQFAKGSAQGAVGGYIVFESKRLLRNYNRTSSVGYVWPSKILNSAGNSIIQNAAANRNFWERWTLHFGFNHLEYDFKSNNRFKFRILPLAFVGTVDGFINGKIDFTKSITHGQFIFISDSLDKEKYLAYTLANSISYSPQNEIPIEDILTHEIIHVYQYESTFSINSLFDKVERNLYEKSYLYQGYDKYFYSDYGYLFHVGSRGIQDLMGIPLTEQYQEREASYYEY